MKESVKTRWIEELRSYEGELCKYALYSKIRGEGEKWSALGLLVKIAVADGIIEKAKKIPRKNRWFFNDSRALLPKAVVKWAQLSAPNPFVTASSEDELSDEIKKLGWPGSRYLVTSLNDNGMDAATIATFLSDGEI